MLSSLLGGNKSASSSNNNNEQQQQQQKHEDNSMVHYFNNAGQAVLSDKVQKVGIDCVKAPPWISHPRSVDSQQNVRELFASLIGSSSDNIAILPSTAFAISMAAKNILKMNNNENETHSRTKILLIQDQYDSAIYPWQQGTADIPMEFDIIPHPSYDSGDWTTMIFERLQQDNDSIGCVCIPPLHWSDGTIIDIDAITKLCHTKNIPLIVDATQAVGIYPIQIHPDYPPTMLCSSSHKWMRGPSGVCLAYIHPTVYNTWQPLDYHGRGIDLPETWTCSRNALSPTGYPLSYYKNARKFDSGGKANSILLPMLEQSLKEVLELGDLTTIQQQLKQVMQPLLDYVENGEGAAHYYISTKEPRSYHIIGVMSKTKTPTELLEIQDQLASRRIYVAVRCGGFRISPHITTTTPDNVQALVKGLQELS